MKREQYHYLYIYICTKWMKQNLKKQTKMLLQNYHNVRTHFRIKVEKTAFYNDTDI